MAILQPSFAAKRFRVVDGDTLTLDGETIRLHGIDAPEAGQTCAAAKGSRWPCGNAAIKALTLLIGDATPVCDDRGKDAYGRTLSVCAVRGRDVNRQMVERGAAWAFRRYADDYAAAEDTARADGRGIWQAPTETAWDYRAHRWAAAAEAAPSDCPIKGNVSGAKRIYHAPWSPWYDRTRVSPAKGERWFCTEAEALAAGWRAPAWGG